MEKRTTVLPFRVGEKAEARTFEEGFRGAWFRCKIIEIDEKKGYLLEYYDYDDDKNEWIKPYQVPRHLVRKAKAKPRELMLRPEYPLIYKEKQLPHASDISRVAVIVDDDWKVGGLVDWLEAYCYWSGRIIKLLGNGKAEIELLPKPLGEGSVYEVFLKDVRPSLNWSPAHGWTMPTQDGDSCQPCARLIKPINSAMETKNAGEETEKLVCSSVEPSLSAPLSSNSIAVSDGRKSSGTTDMQNVVPQKRSLDNTVSMEDAEAITSPSFEHHSTKKTSGPDANSGQIPGKPTANVAVKKLQCNCPPKFRASEGVMLHSARSDTMEAAIVDLEEYINKIKWMEMILLNGISPSDAPSSKWEFVDPNAASSRPK